LARQLDVDLIHTHLWTADVVGRLAGLRAGVPVVSTIHSVSQLSGSGASGSAARRLRLLVALLVDRGTAGRSAAMVAVSDVVAEWARGTLRVDHSKVVTIQNPVVLLPVAEGQSRTQFWAGVGVEIPHQFYLLTVGGVSAVKDLLTAVRATAALRAQGCDAVLISAGALADHAYVDLVRREIEAAALKDAVCLLGPRRDVADLLGHCDLFVFPSTHEGMGIALAEAMLAGLPCVVSDLPVLRGVGGDEVIYVPPGSPAELAAQIRGLLDDPDRRRDLGQRARAAAEVRFDSKSSAARLRELYEQVVLARSGDAGGLR
jgi:glycosyltransferase involved in cell wall biosynthesis